MQSKIKIQKVNKTFIQNNNETTEVLKDINLDIQEGEFICLLGHSGCGKSTLLRIIAGLERDYEGEAYIDGKAFPVRLWIKALFSRTIVCFHGSL